MADGRLQRRRLVGERQQFGPQAELVASRIGEDIHAAANILARHVEKDIGRLENRRGNGRIACALETGAHFGTQCLAGPQAFAFQCGNR